MIELHVTGMTCEHCEAAVRRALEGVAGVTRVVEVDRNTERAIIEGDADVTKLIAAVKDEGYEARVA